MDEVIPSFYSVRDVESLNSEGFDGQAFDNIKLRVGEVVRVIYPEDDASQTKVFVEYDVLVQHRENNTAVSKLYENCLLMNPLAGLADKLRFALRVDGRAVTKDDKQQPVDDSSGSKVLCLCINGEHASAVILGGIRDDKDSDKGLAPKDRSKPYAFLNFEYNGIAVDIGDNGSFTMTYKGATKADGTAREDVDTNAVGTSVTIQQDGTFSVKTKDSEQHLTFDHPNKTATLHSQHINLGNDPDQQAVLGNILVEILEEILDAKIQERHGSSVGPTTPPLNASKYVAIRAKLKTMLSNLVKLKKNP